MARTRAADYELRRGEMVNRAAVLFAETGYLGVSMAEIADACQLSKSLIYHYFASKEDILYEIMQGHVAALGAVAASLSAESAEARLAELTHRFLALYRDAAAKQKVLVNDLRKLPAPRRGEIVKEQRALIALVADLLSQISPDLQADSSKRTPAAMLYFGMINWTHTWFDQSGALDSDSLAELVLDLLLLGALPGRRERRRERAVT